MTRFYEKDILEAGGHITILEKVKRKFSRDIYVVKIMISGIEVKAHMNLYNDGIGVITNFVTDNNQEKDLHELERFIGIMSRYERDNRKSRYRFVVTIISLILDIVLLNVAYKTIASPLSTCAVILSITGVIALSILYTDLVEAYRRRL